VLHRICLLVAWTLLVGCDLLCSLAAAAPLSSDEQRESLTEARAIAIARDAVAENDKWLNNAKFEARRDKSDWVVIAWREPRVPGGDRIIVIDQRGKVAEYVRGK